METVRWAQHFFGPHAYPVFLALTSLGSSAALWGASALLFWLVDPRFGRRLAVVLGLSFVSNQLLKEIVGSQRPYEVDATVATDLARSTGTGGAFPSGHAQNTTAFWVLLGLQFRRRWLWIAGFAMIAAVSLSRLYLGVHSPVDIAGGFVLGALLARGGRFLPEIPPRSWPWRLLVPLAGLGLALAGLDPRGLGFLAGALLAFVGFEPPGAWKRRLALAGGGAAVVGLLSLALRWLPGEPWGTYLRYFVPTFFAADLWPRFFFRGDRDGTRVVRS